MAKKLLSYEDGELGAFVEEAHAMVYLDKADTVEKQVGNSQVMVYKAGVIVRVDIHPPKEPEGD